MRCTIQTSRLWFPGSGSPSKNPAAKVFGQTWTTLPFLGGAVLFGWFFTFGLAGPLFQPLYSTVLLDQKGVMLAANLSPDQQWRFPPGAQVPAKFIRALTTFEDKRFYSHWGVDPLALGRAAVSNLGAGEVVSGGSTLTMQVVRMSRPGAPRTWGQKLIEGILALRLESLYSKEQILHLYAQQAPFGGNVVGLEAAAWRYFGRSAQDLSWAEAALLAVLPNAPAQVHVGRNRPWLQAKRDRLLKTLRDQGDLTDMEYQLARAETLPDQPQSLPRAAGHLLTRFIRENLKPRDFARVQTTLKADLQDRVNEILGLHAPGLQAEGVWNAAILILDVKTGQTLAYGGNIPDWQDRRQGRQNDLIQSPRSTGSLLKPLLFATMVENGELLPTHLIADIPTRNGGYNPENYSRTYAGAVRAWEALAKSLNVPFVRLLKTYGVDRFTNYLRDLGMTTLFRNGEDYGLPLILGGAEGTLWDLTGMYAGLARSALGLENPFMEPSYLTAQKGKVRFTKASSPVSPAAAWHTLQAMQELARPGEEGAWEFFTSSRRVAWKTGTSYGNRDAWAIGVTPEYAVGVWVGNATGEGRSELRGFSTAAPILFDTFNFLPSTGWFEEPTDHETEIQICKASGFLAGPHCPSRQSVLVPPSASRSTLCPYHYSLNLDPTEKWQVTSACQDVFSMVQKTWFILPPAMEYYYRLSHLDYAPPPPFKLGCGDSGAQSPLNLLFPEDGGRLYIPVDLSGAPGKTVFQAAHRSRDGIIFWHLDGEYLGSTDADHHTVEARPSQGPHTLTLWDNEGHTLTRKFTILSK